MRTVNLWDRVDTGGPSPEVCDGTDTNYVAAEGLSCNDSCELVTSLCGNGEIDNSNNEECDDGGESVNCNADCTIAYCGDGTINNTAGELCDDRGESATCNSNCTVAVCGDRIINNTAGEEMR